MRLLPFPFFSSLSQRDMVLYECSDRIVVPKELYEGYSDKNAILRIENEVGEYSGGTLYGPHSGDESLLFVPSWMFYRFTNPIVSLTSLVSVPCEHIQIRPPTDVWFKQEGVPASFQESLLNYKTLTQQSQILVATDPPTSVRIELLHPAKPQTLLVHNVGTVGLTILPSLPSAAGGSESSYRYKPATTGVRIPFVGASYRVGEGADTSPRELATVATVATAATAATMMSIAAKNRIAKGGVL